MSVRVRFAPSPTGRLHVGALRTALFDYLLARNAGGANILRIEDTDRGRYQPEAEVEFIEAMAWSGVVFDEGPHVGGPHAPYRQSERKEAGIYAEQIDKLLASGHVYKAFETSQELDEMRTYQQINKLPQGYFGGDWRDASPEKVAEAEAAGKPYVIRLRIQRNKTIVLQDAVRGRIEWDSNVLDDPVLIKADGMPTYHFAAMVDDHLMGITHVIRGEEWIPSVPKHLAIFQACGWEPPIFVHCPVITGPDGKKLSKRHGATSVLDYRAMGFLPEALMNFVALIGWSPGEDREVMAPDELIQAFALSGLQPSPGKFDFDKLKWMNGTYIRNMTVPGLLQKLREFASGDGFEAFWAGFVPEDGQPPIVQGEPARVPARLRALLDLADRDPDYVLRAIELEQERVTTLADFGDACAFFVDVAPEMDPKAAAKWLGQEHVPALFSYMQSKLSGSVTEADCEAWVREYQAAHGFEKLGPLVHPLRVALTGRTAGPGLWELMALLGPDRMRTRLTAALG